MHLRNVFNELSKRTALVIVEQNLPLVCAIADKIYAFKEGRIVAELDRPRVNHARGVRAISVNTGSTRTPAMNVLRWWWGLLLAFALLALVRVFLPLPFVNEIMIFSIYTMGCNYLLGRVGFISFGQPAYLAVGAYAAAFYLFYFGTNPYVGILVGVAAGVVVSFASARCSCGCAATTSRWSISRSR